MILFMLYVTFTYQLIDRHKIPFYDVGLTLEMNQRPCNILTLASFMDIQLGAIAKFFAGSQYKLRHAAQRSISAQRDFRLGARALSHIEQGSFYSIGRPRATVETYISSARIGNFSDGVVAREEALRNKGPLIFHLWARRRLSTLTRAEILTYGPVTWPCNHHRIVIPTGAKQFFISPFTRLLFLLYYTYY